MRGRSRFASRMRLLIKEEEDDLANVMYSDSDGFLFLLTSFCRSRFKIYIYLSLNCPTAGQMTPFILSYGLDYDACDYYNKHSRVLSLSLSKIDSKH